MDNPLNINKALLKHEYGTIEIINGIFIATYKEETHVTLEVAKKVVQTRLDYQPNIVMPGYADIRGIVSMTKDAREYLALHGSERILAAGLLSTSTFNRVIGNFYLYVNKPVIPTRLFKNKKNAIHWLQQFTSKINQKPSIL